MGDRIGRRGWVAVGLLAVALAVPGSLAAQGMGEYSPSFRRAFRMRVETGEARGNLKAMMTAETSYAEEHRVMTPDMVRIGFTPERGNRYGYFLARRGPVLIPGHRPPHRYVIVAADAGQHPGLAAPRTLAATHCPVTLARYGHGGRLRVGVTGGHHPAFVGVAAGNLDKDPTLDCWSISNVDRRAKDGHRIPAGKPFHEQDDASK